MSTKPDKTHGILLGTAVADSIGLPTEGMTPARISKLGWARFLKHRFFFGRGMWSDDSEQSIMLTQALLSSGGDVERFTRSFAWELRWWILGMPAATGLATAKAIVKLWLGVPPSRSGVFSAGNGSAMRTAPIAAMFPDDAEKRKAFTEAHTRITHSDPKASIATLAVTELTALLLKCERPPEEQEVIALLLSISPDSEWQSLIQASAHALKNKVPLSDFLTEIGGKPDQGISGYVYQTVPCVILLSLRKQWDFKATVTAIIAAGGDTDTTAAIAGALCGAFGGTQSIPPSWIAPIAEWPSSTKDLAMLAQAISHKSPLRIRPRWSPILLLRNLFFLLIVLIHAFTRILPTAVLKTRDSGPAQ